MMIAFLRKNLSNLILKHTSPVVCRSPIPFSPPLHFFSASSETHPGSIRSAVFDVLVHKYEFYPELASRVASELSHLQTPEKPYSILSFFKEFGFSNTQLGKIVKYNPRFLSRNLEGIIKPKIKCLQDAGFSSNDICKMISSNPKILQLSVKNNLIPSLSVLKELFGSTDEAANVIINRSPRLLTANFQDNVLPNIEFLKSCGIPMERIRIILRSPSCLTVKPQVMRKYAEKATEMGLNASSKSFIYAVQTIATMSCENWESKLLAFRNLGFSDINILTMFGKDPPAFSVSIKKINKVKELLLSTGKFNIASIVNCPKSLRCSIENRYVPRLQILEILESKNLIKEWPTLGAICKWRDDQFFDAYIRPYLHEIDDVYVNKSCGRCKKK